MEEAYFKQRQEEIKVQRHRERMRQQQVQEQQDKLNRDQMQNYNLWEELSDYQNMIDEDAIEPDFFVDTAPAAVFIPNEKGLDKYTQIYDRDPFLFDYESEVEPILQVLVGKSIEHARIEVIEEYEEKMLALHKKKFLQLKEA